MRNLDRESHNYSSRWFVAARYRRDELRRQEEYRLASAEADELDYYLQTDSIGASDLPRSHLG